MMIDTSMTSLVDAVFVEEKKAVITMKRLG